MRCVVTCGSTSFPWLVFFISLRSTQNALAPVPARTQSFLFVSVAEYTSLELYQLRQLHHEKVSFQPGLNLSALAFVLTPVINLSALALGLTPVTLQQRLSVG